MRNSNQIHQLRNLGKMNSRETCENDEPNANQKRNNTPGMNTCPELHRVTEICTTQHHSRDETRKVTLMDFIHKLRIPFPIKEHITTLHKTDKDTPSDIGWNERQTPLLTLTPSTSLGPTAVLSRRSRRGCGPGA